MADATNGRPFGWALWTAGSATAGGAAGAVSADHPHAALAMVVGILVLTAGQVANAYGPCRCPACQRGKRCG